MVTALHARDKVPSLLDRVAPKRPETFDDWIRRGATERFIIETHVTPDLARRILENNPLNRLVRESTFESYAAAMRRGEWLLNGENIIIAKTGELNDGQNRLLAVIAADMPVLMSIQFGIERETRSTLNVGQKRTLGDHFVMAGMHNSLLLAAVVRLAWCYDNNIRSLSAHPSVEQAFDYVRANPHVSDFFSLSSRTGTQFKTSGALLAFAAYVCSRVNNMVSGDLLDRVNDGLGLSSTGAPAFRVRERFLQHATGQRPLTRNESAAVFIKAFNAQLSRRKCRGLSWSATGPQAEPFPVPGE